MFLGTFAYAGAQMGTVVTMPISGFLAGSSFGWPSIFYSFGVVAIIWGITFVFAGSDQPSTHPSISEKEKQFIEESLGNSSLNKEVIQVIILINKKKVSHFAE